MTPKTIPLWSLLFNALVSRDLSLGVVPVVENILFVCLLPLAGWCPTQRSAAAGGHQTQRASKLVVRSWNNPLDGVSIPPSLPLASPASPTFG